MSEETKKKMSQNANPPYYWLGKKRPLAAIEKTTAKNKGQQRSQEQKDLLSSIMKGNQRGKANKGKVRTAEVRKKISETLKKRNGSHL